MTVAACTGAPAPCAAPAWEWALPRVVRRTLPNGLRVLLAENHGSPFVWMGWSTRAGSERDTPERAGLAALMPLLLREGGARRDARRIMADVEELGAHLATACDWDGALVSLEVLNCDFAAGLELLLDLVCCARFTPEGLTRVRQRRLAELERRRRQPAAVADDAFARALYGDGAYGRSPFGTPQSLQALDVPTAAAFHARHYRPEASYLVLAGSFDTEAALEQLAAGDVPRAGGGDEALEPSSAAPVAPLASATGVRIVDAPRAAQTELRVGQASVGRDSDDVPALQVLAALLGGGPCSRLAASLRQGLGVTYHVRGRFVARGAGGQWLVETRVASASAAAALGVITREAARLRSQPVPADELEQTRRRLLGLELRRFQYSYDIGGALGQMAFEDDPLDYFERKRRALATVDADRLLELARRHLCPERLLAVAVGPAQVLRPQFSATEAAAGGDRSPSTELVGGEARRPKSESERR